MASAIESLMDQWENDPGFRARMRRDPEEAVALSGVSLTEDEQSALRSLDWSLPDEDLAARASKMG